MGVCILGMGDCSSSSSASVKISNTATNQSITSILNTNSTTVTTSAESTQSINFLPCPVNPDRFLLECEELKIEQATTVTLKSCTNVTDQSASEIRSIFETLLESNSSAEAKAETEFFSTASSEAISATDIRNHISNLIQTVLSNQNIRNIIASVDATQMQNIYMCGRWTANSCVWSQNIQLSLIADQIISSLNDAIVSDSYLADIRVESKNSSDSSSGGIEGIIRALTEFFGNVVFAYIFFVLGVLLILFLVFWVATRGFTSIFARKPSSTSPQVNTEIPSTKK